MHSIWLTRGSNLFRIASLMFFLSGATGLAYEVIWFKRFAHVWGSSALAMACVVASFLAGLGLGAHLLGRVADRIRFPLAWYGALEIAIGVLAALALLEIDLLAPVAAGLYPMLADKGVLYSLVRFLLSLVVLGPICFLMGGTLPLLVRQFTPAHSTLKESTGWLYAINTLGAATGCYLAGFHLLPSFGLLATNLGVVAVNLIIGVAALALTRGFRQPAPAEREAAAAPAATRRRGRSENIRTIYLVSAATGFASLVLQMIWARHAALILGGSTYVFTAILCVFLIGIGLGSLLFDRWLKHRADFGQATLMIAVVLVATAAMGKIMVPGLCGAAGLASGARDAQVFNVVFCLVVSAILQLLPTLAMGLLFPLLVHLTRKSAADAGIAVGNVYAANTVGSILGALLTSPVLIPWLGTDLSLALALGVYLVCGLVLSPNYDLRDTAILGAGLCVGGYSVFVAGSPADPRLTNMGQYLTGFRSPQQLLTDVNAVFYREGPTCNVFVSEAEGERSLRVNGKVDASRRGDMGMQLGLAYYPRFLKPEARSALIIGYGSGATSGASLLFPGTRVTCCEIEPGVLEASKFFSEVNHDPLASPNFVPILDDGRNFLAGTTQRFDLILSEPSNPWLAGVSNLFTREFYETAAPKLTDGGILAQWLQMYRFGADEYALIVRTLAGVFPHVALIQISHADTILLASRRPLEFSASGLAAAQALVDANERVKRDLQMFYSTTDVRTMMLGATLLDEQGIARLLAAAPGRALNTDYNARLEFDAPRRLFRNPSSMDLLRFLSSAADPEWTIQRFTEWQCSEAQTTGLRRRAVAFAEVGRADWGVRLLSFAMQHAPENAALGADLVVADQNLSDEALDRLVRETAARSVMDAARAATQLVRTRRVRQAIAIQQHLVELHPASSSANFGLALAHHAAGNRDAAEAAFRKSIELDPANVAALQAYERFRAGAAATPDPSSSEETPLPTSAPVR